MCLTTCTPKSTLTLAPSPLKFPLCIAGFPGYPLFIFIRSKVGFFLVFVIPAWVFGLTISCTAMLSPLFSVFLSSSSMLYSRHWQSLCSFATDSCVFVSLVDVPPIDPCSFTLQRLMSVVDGPFLSKNRASYFALTGICTVQRFVGFPGQAILYSGRRFLSRSA